MTAQEQVLDLYEWVEAHKDLHLTLKNLQELDVGKRYKVAIFDRNFDEAFLRDKGESNVCRPEELFPARFVTYRGNMEWDIDFEWGETFRHPIHLDLSHLATNWKWSAVENDYIHITQEIVGAGETLPEHYKPIHMPVSDFSLDTRVGWRGPMMFWDALAGLPSVKY